MQERAKILAVDDSSMNLLMVEEILGEDYDLTCVASGEEALVAASKLRPDLVLLDVMMPGIGGYETCRRLRDDKSLHQVKIVLVSAKVDVEDRLEGYASGADDYITKPFESDELLAKVKVFLRLKTVEELDTLKMDILRLLNHETRTPLNGVLGYLELVDELHPSMTGGDRELLTAARASGHQLAGLLSKSLMYCNLSSGIVQLASTPTDLSAIVTAVVDQYAADAGDTQVTVQTAIEPGVTVAGDGEYLRFVCNALVSNAVRYTPEGTTVTVELGRSGDGVDLVVKDEGPGLPEAYRPYVFDAFVPQDLQHHSDGHGLSLAIVKKISELHGGHCVLRDSNGGGAHFVIQLPVAAINSSDQNDCVAEPTAEHQPIA